MKCWLSVSHWMNPLPDIALDTLLVSRLGEESLPATPSPDLIAKSRECHKRVALNVGGVRHEVTWRLLEQFPNSRLGRLARAETHQQILHLVSDYNLSQNEYFFDRRVQPCYYSGYSLTSVSFFRHPRSFNSILNFYRTGKLHINEEMCVLAFQADLEFWEIDDTILETCCRERYERQLAVINQEMEAECVEMQEDAPEMFSSSWSGR